MSPPASNSLVLGIDFGTTYTAAAVLVGERVLHVQENGISEMPSVVHFPSQGNPVVGKGALISLISDPLNTVVSVKRLLGHSFDHKQVRTFDAGIGYKIVRGPQNRVAVEIRGNLFAPEQIASYILDHVRNLAEAQFSTTISKIVVGVPATASPEYLAALKKAAALANLEIVQIIPEPIAGALALGAHTRNVNRKLAVCDFGGGTLDTTLIDQRGKIFTPTITGGNAFLGGDDFDRLFAQAIGDLVFRKFSFKMETDQVTWGTLLFKCEAAKRKLSRQDSTPLTMSDAFVYKSKRANLDINVDRKWLEKRWLGLARELTTTVSNLFSTVNSPPMHSIDNVLLIGGTSLVPLVQKTVSDLFGSNKLFTTKQANLAVVTGLALQTAVFQKNLSENIPVLTQ